MTRHDHQYTVHSSAHAAQEAKTVALHSRRLMILIVILTVAVGTIDQLTKMLALERLEHGVPTSWFLGEALGWKLLFNPGAALSIGTGMTWLLTLVAVVVVGVVVVQSRRIGSAGWAIAFGLLLGGAVGNLIDRFFRDPGFARGHVVDFINYGDFFVGNVADIAIVLAAVVIVLLSIRGVAISHDPVPDADLGNRAGANDDQPDDVSVTEEI